LALSALLLGDYRTTKNSNCGRGVQARDDGAADAKIDRG